MSTTTEQRPEGVTYASETVIPKTDVDGFDALEKLAQVARFSPAARARALRELQEDIGAANAAKGFHQEGEFLRTAASDPFMHEVDPQDAENNLRNYETSRLALIVTEAAEAIEELRNGRRADETWYSAKVNGDTYAWNAGEKPDVLDDTVIGKPEGVPSEVADVVIRAFDFAHEAGFDLAAIIAEKLAYNASRPFKHGRKF